MRFLQFSPQSTTNATTSELYPPHISIKNHQVSIKTQRHPIFWSSLPTKSHRKLSAFHHKINQNPRNWAQITSIKQFKNWKPLANQGINRSNAESSPHSTPRGSQESNEFPPEKIQSPVMTKSRVDRTLKISPKSNTKNRYKKTKKKNIKNKRKRKGSLQEYDQCALWND